MSKFDTKNERHMAAWGKLVAHLVVGSRIGDEISTDSSTSIRNGAAWHRRAAELMEEFAAMIEEPANV